MQPPFALADLERMATASSFERGQDYYDEGAVRELTYNSEQYTARVRGSFNYRITIGGTRTEPRMHCTCPYDYGGICKHLVAVGLAILEGEAETGAVPYEEATLAEEPAVSLHRFSELFEQTTDAVKVQFLKQILAQNTALKTQFTKYAETYAGSLIPDSTSTSSYAEVLENVR